MLATLAASGERSGNLNRIEDAGFDHVFKLESKSIKTKLTFLLSSTVLTARSSSKPEFLANQRRGSKEFLTISYRPFHQHCHL